jgi:hypothetical protein
VTELEDLRDLGFRVRQCHDHGQLSIQGQTIAFVGARVLIAIEQALVGQYGAQRGGYFTLSYRINLQSWEQKRKISLSHQRRHEPPRQRAARDEQLIKRRHGAQRRAAQLKSPTMDAS